MSENSQEESEISIDRKEFRKRYKEFMKNNIHHLNILMTLSRERVGSFGTVIERNAEQFADKIAIKFEEKQITYKEFNELVNKYAHYLLSLGLEKGDIVDIIMGNRIEYVTLVGAIAKIGVEGSLINSDLREKSLTHCVKITLGKVIVVGEERFEAFDSIKDDLGLDDQILCFSPDTGTMPCPDGYTDLSLAVEKFPITNPPPVADIDMFDNHVYIFTSGTTGLPKAAYFPRQRMKDIGCSHAQFVDRVGDTFRWKGHNMSTTEVEKIFNDFEQVLLSTVYGVQIPGTDGRAPMATFAAKVDEDKIDFKGLAELLTNNLPPYGVPLFLRLKTKLPTTSTHKFQKGPLKKEGFDLELIEDALYVKVPREANYIPLTKVLYEDILKGNYKF